MMLLARGMKPDLVVAAGYKTLSVRRSPSRVSPQGLTFPLAQTVCAEFGIEYVEQDHDDPALVDLLGARRPDIGVILGARILRQPVIEQFAIGVLNMHPGLLPHNRGLDNLKWAIIGRLPQGVSTHLIDSSIDRGHLIERRIVDVLADDTLLDVNLRIQNMEQAMMIDALSTLRATGAAGLSALGAGEYHTAMDEETDARMLAEFASYRQDYAEIRAQYESGTT